MPNLPTPRLAALILAAGYASRMGRSKALLPLAGQPTVARLVNSFRTAGITAITVVTGHGGEQLAPLLGALEVSNVPNPNFSQGMYSSIQAGLRALPAEVEACFLLPVDIPLLRPATITALAADYAANRPLLLYPTFRGERGHPPLLGRTLFAEILAGSGEGGLAALLQKHEAAADDLAVCDEGILLDMDTPADYARLAELARHRHVPSPAEGEAMLDNQGVGVAVRRHSRAVATLATSIAERLASGGTPIDIDLVRAGGLLHDIAKGQPAHAAAGQAIVAGLGYPELGEVIGQHMDFDFARGGLSAAAIVFLADKLLLEDRRVSLASRFAPAFRRFADDPAALYGAHCKYQSACAIADAIAAQCGLILDQAENEPVSA